MSTPFAALAETLRLAAATRGRNQRVRLLADLLTMVQPDEVAPAVRLMLGRGAGARSGVSWATLIAAAGIAYGNTAAAAADLARDPTAAYVDVGDTVEAMARAAARPPGRLLAIGDVERGFLAAGAARGRKAKERALAELLRDADPPSAAWIARNAVGEMRTGAQEGLLLEAIAAASGQPAASVRRALVGTGDVAAVAEAALVGGPDALAALVVRIGVPVPPMLADGADTLLDAYRAHGGRLALEWKLDGARVQVHRDGERVQLWSRRMTDVTDRLPDVADAVRRGVAADRVILEGEVIVLDRGARPIPFQDVMRRWLRQNDTDQAALEQPASLYLFDCLMLEGRSTIDLPYAERWAALTRASGDIPTMPRLLLEGPPESSSELLERAQAFYDDAVARGHEGVMAKAIAAPYAPGRRGASWLKVKAQATADLVVIGADWGTGRRHRWLSNYHLACRDETTGQFLSVGETFKGLTDAEMEHMTTRLAALEVARRGGYVSVRPEVVVEVTFNGVQRSTRLPSGVALRFARITRIRDDKTAAEADSLTAMRSLLPGDGG